MTMEVRNLLSQAMLDMPGCRSENLTPIRPNPVVVLMPPPHKPNKLLQPVDMSSQVSTEMVEASVQGIPTSNSPTATTSRSRSITPPADTTELWGNANKGLKELLATKASIDACRQRAIWELGMELHSNKSQVTKFIKEAKAICSQVTLDAQALCFATVKEAKAACIVAVKEAKTT